MPKFTQHFVELGGDYYYKYLHQDKDKREEIAFERGVIWGTDP